MKLFYDPFRGEIEIGIDFEDFRKNQLTVSDQENLKNKFTDM